MTMNIKYKGVIFDLDGVIVTTDDCHYLAWKKMADEECIHFDRIINERLRVMSPMNNSGYRFVVKTASIFPDAL